MKIQISDELFDRLKNCVVDPFDDTPEFVINRLIDIVEKAKSRWSSWDVQEQAAEEQGEQQEQVERKETRPKKGRSWREQADVVL